MNPAQNQEFLKIISEYNKIVEDKKNKVEQMSQLKEEIKDCDKMLQEAQLESEKYLYRNYTQKDLLRIADIIEKCANKDTIREFRNLIDKFSEHNLNMNDISSLGTFIKIYGDEVKGKRNFLKLCFKTLGGNL